MKNDYLQWVLEQLSGAGRISSRRMFGAFGLYQDDVFFAIISSDILYFKVNDANRADYETRGAARFRPYRDNPELSMSYYAVPADILEDAEQCADWARRAVVAAVAAKALPARKSHNAAGPRSAVNARGPDTRRRAAEPRSADKPRTSDPRSPDPGGAQDTRTTAKTRSAVNPHGAHKSCTAAKLRRPAKIRQSGHLGTRGNPEDSRKSLARDAKLLSRRARS